jgi:hypothetical protein
MKRLIGTTALLITIAVLAGDASAQKKKKPAAKKPATVPVTAVLPPLEVRVAREKTENQMLHLNRFIDVLGPIAQGIEDFERSALQTKPPAAAASKNESNKQNTIAAIRNMRATLAALETEYRNKPDLKKYLPHIEGITGLGATSEDSAIAGKFVLAKEPLRTAAQRLRDTVAIMPRSPAL